MMKIIPYKIDGICYQEILLTEMELKKLLLGEELEKNTFINHTQYSIKIQKGKEVSNEETFWEDDVE